MNNKRQNKVLLGIFLLLAASFASCTREKVQADVLNNLEGKWKVSSASIRNREGKAGNRISKKPDLNNYTYEFNKQSMILQRNSNGDTVRLGKVKIQTLERTNYIMFVDYQNTGGIIDKREYWEVTRGRGDRFFAFIETDTGEIRLTLDRI